MTTIIEVKELSDNEKDSEFSREYAELREKYKREIIVIPQWKISQDTGDWRLVLAYTLRRVKSNSAN